MSKLSKKDILSLIQKDKWMMGVLRAAESLNLPDWWIGAGFVRSKVWDHVHGYKKRTPLPDIDLIYFNSSEKNPEQSEQEHKNKLIKFTSGIEWQVKNQARMHIYHKRKSYKNSTEALSDWAETATCIGVRLEGEKLVLTAPFGVGDLTNLILRPIPNYDKKYKHSPGLFKKRMKDKNWLKKWPRLRIIS